MKQNGELQAKRHRRRLLLGGSSLGLGSSTQLLQSVLLFLLLLPGNLGLGFDHALSDQPELGLKLLGKVHGVVDEGEAGALAATKVGLEAENEDASPEVLHSVSSEINSS